MPLDKENIRLNPGLRQAAKILLNSKIENEAFLIVSFVCSWGKFAEKSRERQTEYASELRLQELLQNPTIRVRMRYEFDDDTYLVSYTTMKEVAESPSHANVVIGEEERERKEMKRESYRGLLHRLRAFTLVRVPGAGGRRRTLHRYRGVSAICILPTVYSFRLHRLQEEARRAGLHGGPDRRLFGRARK